LSQFVHLHLHTQYSLLDGANLIDNVLKLAHSLGQPAIAMTDHGNMHGAIEFHDKARKCGIKPIIGCELYVTPESRFERKGRAQGGAGTYHITALAQNMKGYHNLCRLVSLAYKEGFYFKPRVDHELLKAYSEGIMILSGCLASELGYSAKQDDEKKIKNVLEFYSGTFKDRFYLEVQPHHIPEQQKLNEVCKHFSESMGLPLVASTDCHYGHKEDHFAQEVLMCISTGKKVTDEDRIKHDDITLHLKTAQEMSEEFGDWKYASEAIKNSVAIADQCNVEIKFKQYYMPQFSSESTRPLIELMAEKAREGLKKRIEVFKQKNSDWAAEKVYNDRLQLEIDLIDSMGFAGYFLVVADFIVWAKDQDIPVGPGRGSAAGSLVAYALRITEVDPITNKLLFERFLNPERVSLPDIDVDFCIHGRDRVIKYVVEKYGKEKVAQIATFGTLKAKAAIKDVGRALGVSYAETDKIAQLVPPPRQGFDFSLTEAIKLEKRLADYAKGEGKQLITLALKLEGLTRHASTHAAGVVIGDRPLMDMLPMMVDKDGNDVTQYTMKYVEQIGLVKFDFLGLKTLTVIHSALKIIKESSGVDINLELLPLDDEKTYSILCAGDTTGVFQLESSGITEMTMRLKPSCFNDLVATIALYRPGPLDAGMVDHYIERKHGREEVSLIHPLMEDVLDDTYGIMLYQEQIMQLARELAGYSLGQADVLRKVRGKKDPVQMAKQKEGFVSGALEKGVGKKQAEEIFSQIETFARYGFNRSHSAAYAMISFQTAYLKAHYKVAFMAALMSNEMGDTDKTLKNLNECRKQGIEVLPPDLNESSSDFSVGEGKIRYGLAAVKGIGEKAVSVIVENRETGGPFKDLCDFIARIDLKAINKRVVESLIKCGALDFSGHSRREMAEKAEDILKAGQALKKDQDTNQMGLFSDELNHTLSFPKFLDKPEWPINTKLAFEREALGSYISGHPLEKFRRDLKRMGAITTEGSRKLKNKSEVTMAGVVTALKKKNTKKGNRYATFALEDWLGSIESIAWPEIYQKSSHVLLGDDPVLVKGKVDITEERCVLLVDEVQSLITLRDSSAKQGLIILREEDQFDSNLGQVRQVLEKYPGNCPVKVRLEIDKAEVLLMLRSTNESPMCVLPSEELCDEIEQIFGRPVLSFV